MAGTCAAEFFRDRDAEKAHLGKTLPQLAVIRLLAIEHDAHRLGRALFGKKLPRFVAKLFLFIGEIEIHGGLIGLGGGYFFCYASPPDRGPQNTSVFVLFW